MGLVIDTLSVFGWNLIGVILMPIVLSLLNVKINNILASEDPFQDLMLCIICKIIYEVSANKFGYHMCRALTHSLILDLNMAKIKCGVIIPGVNARQHRELNDDKGMLQDFLSFLPMTWSAIVSFVIAIFNFKLDNTARALYMLCIVVAIYVTSLVSDNHVDLKREKEKAETNHVITKFDNTYLVQTKLSLGYSTDPNFEAKRRNKHETRHRVQRYVIIAANLFAMYNALASNNIKQYYIFGSVSWMIGCVADNLKVFSDEYIDYMKKYFKLVKAFKQHSIEQSTDPTVSMPSSINTSIEFVHASFGYYGDICDAGMASAVNIIIADLNFTFNSGIYYLESPNGTGKSTLMKMFSHTLSSGEVYFNGINRKYLSHDTIASTVLYLPQSSEYTPTFTRKELEQFQGHNPKLEQALKISELFNDTAELSGGQRKRMFIYLAMISTARVLLFDEIFAEISAELQDQVLDAIVDYGAVNGKVILIVGHGLQQKMKMYPNIKPVAI